MGRKRNWLNGEMVRAILDGRKTQTRRVVKHRENRWEVYDDEDGNMWPYWPCYVYAEPEPIAMPCPYGEVGDRLWLRETWRVWSWHDGKPIIVQYRDGKTRECEVEDERLCDYERWEEAMCIQSGDDCTKAGMFVPDAGDIYVWPNEEDEDRDPPTRWRPSVHMPRWASRISLEVKDVRVERVQEITPGDAKREGAPEMSGLLEYHERGPQCYVDWFCRLWDSINGKTYPWDSNPWVWVIEFARVSE